MQASAIVCSVKPLCCKKPSGCSLQQSAGRHIYARSQRSLIVAVLKFAGAVTVTFRIKLDYPMLKSIWQRFRFGTNLACIRIKAESLPF